MLHSIQTAEESSEQTSSDRYRCGTLVYTKAGLFALFFWMLWGDFCFTLMVTIWHSIMPLVLKSQGAPNVAIAIVTTTIPQAMNFVLNPIISTASDRYRSKRGRRIPFMLMATPFITLFLILLGFSQELGGLLHSWIGGSYFGLTPSTVTIGLIAVLIVGFYFFDLFVGTVFWYLFNDVVPSAFMGRFLGLFRVIGTLAGALFNLFFFKYAESHTSTIFLGVALLYGTAFLLMCLNVKEGKYPPPDRMSEKKGFSLAMIGKYFKDTFSHRIFLLVYSYSALQGIGLAISVFSVFMAFSIGLTKDDVGKVAGIGGIIAMLLMYPAGALLDRIGPLRIMLWAQVVLCIQNLVGCVYLFHDFPKDVTLWIYAVLTCVNMSALAINGAALLPMFMGVFPHEKFGQFCAANSMCAALGVAVFGIFAGAYLDVLKRLFSHSEDYYFRFVPAWFFFFSVLGYGVTCLVFWEWKKLGGKNYRPPIKDNFADFHDSPCLECPAETR